MKFIFRIIVVALLSHIALLFLPWWSVAIVAFAVGALMSDNSINAFIAGVLGVGLLWFGMALYINFSFDSMLPERVAALFQFSSPVLLAAITGLIGAVVGGLAGLSGSYFKKLFVTDTKYRYR